MKILKSPRLRNASRAQITRKPLIAEATVPQKNGPANPGGNPPLCATFSPLKIPAPPMIGSDSRKEKRAADDLSSPMILPAVIVMPDLETPGCSATA